MSKLTFKVPNYYHLAPRNYGKAKYEYPQVIDYLENEIHRLYLIIDKAIEHICKCCYDEKRTTQIDDLWGDELKELLDILRSKE